jgi:hypothetical protein
MKNTENRIDTRHAHVVSPENTGGNTCEAVQECPCMHDKPFMHVLAQGYGEDATEARNTPGNKRCVILYSEIYVEKCRRNAVFGC